MRICVYCASSEACAPAYLAAARDAELQGRITDTLHQSVEGIADYILEEVRAVIKSSPLYIAAALLLKPALRKSMRRLHYSEYGGANLLGVNGVVVIAHGRSDASAIKNALRVAKAAAESSLLETVRTSLTPSEPSAAAGR